MSTVKTAISLDESLLEQADAAAQEMNTSRSRVFALALELYLRQRRNQQLLEQINAAYDDLPDPEEQAWQRAVRRHQRQLVEGEW